MMGSVYDNTHILTESDVEQKLVYPLLTNPLPNGLGYSDADFCTKPNIRKLTIDKGGAKKTYYPDYVVLLNGIPSVVVEAKSPNEDLGEAGREARLYAAALNTKYPSGVNPCEFVLCTNGTDLTLGHWDDENPLLQIPVGEISPIEPRFSEFTDILSKQAISKHSEQVLKRIRKGSDFIKPIQMLGGKAVGNQTVADNSFGSHVSLEYKYIFNPETMEEREKIVENSYVPSKRKESHVAQIDKIIRAAIPPSSLNARVIQDTGNPKEIIEEFSKHDRIRNELCLLIGAVGAGKSTFTDYMRKVALPKDLADSTDWININLNAAPLSKDRIYDWILTEAIALIKSKHNSIDFDALSNLMLLYKDDLSKVGKGRASLYPNNSEKYKDIINEELKRLQSNKHETLLALLKFLYTSKGKTLIMVLDNCDKRNRDDQLLLFEVASWLKKDYSCCVFLPLRDSTYDQFCDSPPLDTVIKDLVFRIDAPLLQRVIYQRLRFAIREIQAVNTDFSYYLANGMKVQCRRDDVARYLGCIIDTLFQDTFMRRIITGLSGSNIRKGIEIVLEFCKSGHISEDEILKIRQSDGEYRLQNHITTNILLRRKRLYYSDAHSFLLNLFASENTDSLPDPFARIYILAWLRNRLREYGPNRTKGYHRVSDLIMSLQLHGHASNVVIRELDRLSRVGCIVSESLENDLDENDLISIASPGIIHLDLLKNISYLAAAAEDTYFRDKETAKKIRDNMTGAGAHQTRTKQATLSTSKLLVDYIFNYHKHYFSTSADLLDDADHVGSEVIDDLKKTVDSRAGDFLDVLQIEQLVQEYAPGTPVQAQVVAIKAFGLFVEFGIAGSGMIHISDLCGVSIGDIDEGDWINCEVIEYTSKHGRFRLRLVGLA